MKTNVYRDGKVHVMAKMCATCIFRPETRENLGSSRIDGMIEVATKQDGCIPCHHTIYGQDKRGEAVCRGFYERRGTMTLRLAEAFGIVEFQAEEA